MSDAFTVVPGILEVTSNRSRIPAFAFGDTLGHGAPDAVEGGLDEPIRVEFEVADELARPEGSWRSYQFFSGREGSAVLFFDRRILGPIRARALIDARRSVPLLRVNPAYHRFGRLRINNLYPPGTVLADLACVRLLEAGLLPVHCAAVAGPGAGGAALVFAPANTGKTLTAVRSAERYDASLLAEDVAVLDGRRVHSTPLRTTVESYSETDLARGPGLGRRLMEWIPVLAPYTGWGRRRPDEYLGGDRMRAAATVEAVVILDTGEEGVSELEAEGAWERIRNLNRYDFHYWRDPVLIARAYFDRDFDLRGLEDRERGLLRDLAGSVPAYRLSARDPLRYADLLAAVMGW